MDDEFKKIRENAHMTRGVVLNEISLLEVYFDFYISDYFGINREKSDEFNIIILLGLRVGFSAKKDIIINIMKRNKTIHNYPDIERDLKDLIFERNVLAHGVLDLTPNSIEYINQGYIVFYKKDGDGTGKPVLYNQEKFLIIQAIIQKYIEIFKSLTKQKHL
ncbi:hypothetical protein GALL_172820 [mine drainage metagenome]|uniref:RiboL-PSP-HEPN domain-containing protein n=1 Tax=mine drainage metagenome TaxID=410659 RepID=A0A1J5S959_9ZZZZ